MIETDLSPPFSLHQIIAALLIGSVALLMLGLQPTLLGELVDNQVISTEGMSIVVMSEIIALGLGVLLANVLLPMTHFKLITVLAAITVATLDAATCYGSGDQLLVGLRGTAGLAEGVLVWVTTSIIVRSSKPDRLAAAFLVVHILSQAGLVLLLTTFIVPRAGWQGSFALVAVISLLPWALVRLLPGELKPLRVVDTGVVSRSPASLLPLIITFLQMAAISSLWAHMVPLSKVIDFDAMGSSKTMISTVFTMQILGGFIAFFTVRRLGVKLVLTGGSLILASIAFAIDQLPQGSLLSFSALLMTFGFFWLFIMPFQIGLAFQVDPSGRIAILVPVMQLLGSAVGPLIGLFAAQGEVAVQATLISGTLAVLAADLLLIGRRQLTPVPLQELRKT